MISEICFRIPQRWGKGTREGIEETKISHDLLIVEHERLVHGVYYTLILIFAYSRNYS